MNISILGNQIGKFRRAMGMTQEELGKIVGVSTQAVSRWECGGAPDTGMLPAVADALHVTIDALFGREGGQPMDVEETIARWAASLPEGEFPNALAKLLWCACVGMLSQEYGTDGQMKALESCEMECKEGKTLVKTQLEMDSGFLFGSYARDMCFMSVYPEPEKGYGAFFAENGEYREFFGVLARPNVMELLLELASEKYRFYTVSAISRRLGITKEEAEAALQALARVNLLDELEMELADGIEKTYSNRKSAYLIPLLYSARYLLQEGDVSYINSFVRNKPWLRKTDTGRAADALEKKTDTGRAAGEPE